MKYYNTYKKLGLALITALVLTACGSSSTPTEPTGIDRIVEYAQNGGTAPTLQDYLDAGVTGIDSEAQLAEINQVVEGLVAEDVDTTEEVQALVDALGVEVPTDTAAPRPSPSPSPSPTPDTTAPVITITGGSTVTVVQNASYTDAGATATDDVDGTVSVTSSGTVDTSTVGDYTITYTATDSAGNTATATRTVTVEVEVFTITHNGTTYGIVTSPYTGKVWLDRNLGAAQVCTSSTDTACYGDYYQWGRNFDGHQDSTSATTTILATDVNNAGSSDRLGVYDWASVDSDGSIRAANWSKTDGSSVCPSGFRVPTMNELEAEAFDTSGNSRDVGFLNLPFAGREDGSDQGIEGYIYSSTPDGEYARFLIISSSSTHYNSLDYRSHGRSVRCLRD